MNLTHISATCCVYTITGYLLVYDDQRDDSLVVISENKGGALELFDKVKDGHPLNMVRTIFFFPCFLPCTKRFLVSGGWGYFTVRL